MSRRLMIASLLVGTGVLAGLVLAGRLQGAGGNSPATVDGPAAPVPPAAAVSSPLALTGDLPDFSAVAERTVPGVTNISSIQVVRQSASPFADDPFFRQFFRDVDDLFGVDRHASSLGSGVIVSRDGYVLTNRHVVGERVTELTVSLADRREMQARIIGSDDWTDIALLRIDADDLPAIPWGDSSALRVAEWVLAIGNPFQLNQTVTLGIVSAVGRANLGVATYEDFIQTDAAINPGNSGGALVNRRGELVGINTAIFSRTGGYQGIGFAVPSNLARRVMDDLIRHGEVRRGSIGYLELSDVTSRLAAQLGVPAGRGALVSRMRRDTPAYRTGIRPGDVIAAFNDQAVVDASHFLRLLADSPIGDTVTLGLLRDGQTIEVRVPVAQAEAPRR